MKKLHPWFLMAVLSLSATAAHAEEGSADPGERRHMRMEQRMRRITDRVLRRDVGLDEAKTTKIQAILEKYAPERKKLHEELGRQKRALRDLIEDDSADEKAYADALAGLKKAKKALQALRDKQVAEVEKQLTPRQQARLMLSLKKARHRMEGGMHERRRPDRDRDRDRDDDF